ncbi:zinc-ribbon domain-containing protein [Sporosarcina sp. Marseille-Q4063]|uniref:TcaA NTF2-like domain-containing protein n=1 Tax=Sporosarcina sp. Marseille-Q4063 TaxID=2810514 RepID=UPI001BAF6B85|nr:zinc-ribbon domain-containing protein [Sporosarcina sp. Marseille-Q4063]QUW21332.1 zinc-ribbon domain-containing protein [Sporosarcina sp. Marseille-Q4063]
MGFDFCSECGKSLQAGERFCANCGHCIESEQIEEVNSTRKNRHIEDVQVSKMPKKQKIVIGIVAAITVALFSGHFYIKSIVSTDKQIAAIHEALHEGNGEKFLKAVHVDDDVIFDSEAYMELLVFDGAPYLIEEIRGAIDQVEKTGLPGFISAYFAGDLLKIEREKYLGIYNKIKITALAYEVKLETDLPSGKVLMRDKEWNLTGKPINLGRFLPGHYPVLLTNAELDDSTLEQAIMVTSESTDNVLSITKDAYMVSLVQDNEDGLLIIDGKETGKKVSEMPEIGPLFAQNPIELSVMKEIDGEQQQSLIVEAYPGDEVSFVFEVEQVEEEIASSTIDFQEDEEELTEAEIAKAAGQHVLSFRDAYESALNKRDFSLIAPFLLTDSVAYWELVGFVRDLKNENYTYEFTHNETTDWLIHPDGDVAIDTYEVFDFINHKGNLTHYKREKTYSLTQDADGNYKIYNIAIGDTIRE